MTAVVSEGEKLLVLDPNQTYAIESDEPLTDEIADRIKTRFRAATGCAKVIVFGPGYRIARERSVSVTPSVATAAETILRGIIGAFDVDDTIAAGPRDWMWLADTQAMCLAEEAGEFLGAYRRWAGRARRSGDFEDVKAELADVVISAHVMAKALNVDLDELVAEKLETVLARGWRETAART